MVVEGCLADNRTITAAAHHHHFIALAVAVFALIRNSLASDPASAGVSALSRVTVQAGWSDGYGYCNAGRSGNAIANCDRIGGRSYPATVSITASI